MKRKQTVLFSIGIILLAISIWQIHTSQEGLSIISIDKSDPPLTIIMPSDVPTTSRPTILIAHGFAGSSQLMRGFALTLAHAGYITVSWDFLGHGANPNPLVLSTNSNTLLQEANAALKSAESTGMVDTQRVAILGHSMGSGVALSYGITYPVTYATIAVSPTGNSVTPILPHNLLLMAGSLEGQFVNNAKRILSQAGGENSGTSAGYGRKLVIIPNVEHISILFSPKAHSTARMWLDKSFGNQPGAVNYTDRRILWFGLGIIGATILGSGLLTTIQMTNPISIRKKSIWVKGFALFGSGIAAALIIWLLSLIGVMINQLLGMLVGGYMLIWFGVAGIIGLLIIRPSIVLPTMNELISGFVAFAALWLGVGLLGNYIWLPWLLIPERLQLWIPGTILLFPWFFMVGNLIDRTNLWIRLVWWFGQSISIILSMILAIQMNPELGFLFLILPLAPIMIGLHNLVIAPKNGTWAYSLSGAMFTAWLILAVFPLY